EHYSLAVNGERFAGDVEAGFVTVDRAWKPDDSVVLNLPMPVRRVVAHEKVVSDRDRVALMRGPLVYCLEWTHATPGYHIDDVVLPEDPPLTSKFQQDVLGGVQVVNGSTHIIRGAGEALTKSPAGVLKPTQRPITEEIEFTAIPYFAWANRG